MVLRLLSFGVAIRHLTQCVWIVMAMGKDTNRTTKGYLSHPQRISIASSKDTYRMTLF